MNEYERMKLKEEEMKENRFLKAYNDAPEHIKEIVLCALGIHDDVECEEDCKIYDFNSYLKERG